MNVHRALAVWMLIVVAETLHGILRQLFITPVMGDLPARQIGVAIGSLIILAIACACIRWMGARTMVAQLHTGALWVVLIVVFEITLGTLLGYTQARLLADYDPRQGGYMLAGLAFMLLSPVIAARLRQYH